MGFGFVSENVFGGKRSTQNLDQISVLLKDGPPEFSVKLGKIFDVL